MTRVDLVETTTGYHVAKPRSRFALCGETIIACATRDEFGAQADECVNWLCPTCFVELKKMEATSNG